MSLFGGDERIDEGLGGWRRWVGRIVESEREIEAVDAESERATIEGGACAAVGFGAPLVDCSSWLWASSAFVIGFSRVFKLGSIRVLQNLKRLRESSREDKMLLFFFLSLFSSFVCVAERTLKISLLCQCR